MNAPSLRGCAAVVLVSTSLVCLIYAAAPPPTALQKAWLKKCNSLYDTCMRSMDVNENYCIKVWAQCLKDHNCLMPINGPGGPQRQGSPPPIQGLPNPTPGKGPQEGNYPGKSNPTATPKPGKGRGGLSGLPKSSPTPTPSTSGPTLLNKKSTPTPTPSGTPRKGPH